MGQLKHPHRPAPGAANPLGSRLRALGVSLLLAACGGGGGSATGETTTAQRIATPAPSVAEYSTESTPGAVRGGDYVDIVERGIRAAADRQEVTLDADGRLAQLAEWCAQRLGEGAAPPPHEVVELFARSLGLVEPVPHLVILGNADAAALEPGLRDVISRFLDRQRYTHFGAAVASRDGLTLAVVALASRLVVLEPVPRHVSAGTTVRFSGRLSDGYGSPVVAVQTPEGIERLPAGDGPTFEVDVPLPLRGENRIELLAEGPAGDQVLVNVPVYVGVPVPTEVALGEDEGVGVDSDAAAVARDLWLLINRTRTEAGLPPLSAHAGLDAVSTAHSRDMVEHGFVGHRSETTGGAPERVRAAGYRSGLVLENIGRGYGSAEIHRGLLASPGHRANILNPDVTHVGIGVVAEPEANRQAFVATELFLRMASAIDEASAPDRILAAVNEGRAARGAGDVLDDENLSRAAAEAAHRYMEEAGLDRAEVVEDASRSLRSFGMQFSRVGGLMIVASRVEDAYRLEPTFDPDVRYVGIGVAQGNHPDHPPNSIAVVILLGYPR